MTNIVAAIIVTIAASITSGLETNKTEVFPKHIVNEPCPEGIMGCAVFHGRYVNDDNPKSKTVMTKVELVNRLTFEWEGEQRTVEKRETVRETAQEFKRSDGWEKVGNETDRAAQKQWIGLATNSGAITIDSGITVATNTWLYCITNR